MKIIIVGAVAGGASAAARLRRMDEEAEIIMLERGEYISYANCGLPYYIGNVIKEREKLFVQTAASFQQRFHMDVRVRNELLSINPDKKIVTVKNLVNAEVYEETYDKLVLSTGAEPIRPPLPGINLPGIFTLRNVQDTDTIKGYIEDKKIRKAVIVGAGFIGLEMAENLHGLGLEVDMIEMGNQVLAPVDFPMAAIVQQHIRSKGISLYLKSAVAGFSKSGDQLTITLASGESLEADLVILSIGVRPDTRIAHEAGLKMGAASGIWVNEYLQTSNPDIYAVGDAIEFKNPLTKIPMVTYLAGPANKQGRLVADNIALGNHRKYQGAINNAIVKVFDMTVATAGVAAKHLQALHIAHMVSTNHSGSHAGYFPGSKQLSIQLAFSPSDGRLYGAQVVGYEGVDKRIDVLANMIKANGTIYDLVEFEHAYAPPYSSAKDPINMAGFVAENILQNRLQIIYWDELDTIKENQLLIDVRRSDEFAAGKIENAINLPLDEIRERLHEIPKDKTIYIYCEAGLRGYLPQRILKQRGFDKVFNLSGGYYLWNICQSETRQTGLIR